MIKSFLKNIIPNSIRYRFRQYQKITVYFWRRQRIRLPVATGSQIKIIIGAAMTSQKGWFSTNEQWLDITKPEDWRHVFHGKALLTHVLAEHVFEHLTEEGMYFALRLINQHMKSGGRIRIAVPDGNHPDPRYIRHVGIGGIGADAEDHKQLINCNLLMKALDASGFSPKLMEGYQDNGDLVAMPIDIESGVIVRSRSNHLSMASRSGWAFPDANTSLIVDGIKRV
ncbi:hypothetical protein [Mesorhizobium japonicum]|uniref:hypothetical protein n=1 Tax=Mesorhizobium japonicum TaxID=2066070 RepID=UPI003B5A4F1E